MRNRILAMTEINRFAIRMNVYRTKFGVEAIFLFSLLFSRQRLAHVDRKFLSYASGHPAKCFVNTHTLSEIFSVMKNTRETRHFAIAVMQTAFNNIFKSFHFIHFSCKK